MTETTVPTILRNDAHGAVIVLILGIILMLAAAGALVVDLGRAQYTKRVLQMSADAAALAATVEFTYSSNNAKQRWANAKRAAFNAARENLQIYNLPFPDTGAAANHQGDNDACESTGDYRSQTIDDGRVKITIARGLYQDEFPGAFQTLEHASVCNEKYSPLPDAAQVVIEIRRVDALFAPLVFGTSLPSIRVVATSARHTPG